VDRPPPTPRLSRDVDPLVVMKLGGRRTTEGPAQPGRSLISQALGGLNLRRARRSESTSIRNRLEPSPFAIRCHNWRASGRRPSVGAVLCAARIFCLEAFGSVRACGVHASRCAAGSSEVLDTRSLRSLPSRRQPLLLRPPGCVPPSDPARHYVPSRQKTRGKGRARPPPGPDITDDERTHHERLHNH